MKRETGFYFHRISSNDKEDCITSEEAIHGNLKKISISADDQTKYDPLAFRKSREEKVRSVLQSERTKRKRMKFYLTLQVRFTKTRGIKWKLQSLISTDAAT